MYKIIFGLIFSNWSSSWSSPAVWLDTVGVVQARFGELGDVLLGINSVNVSWVRKWREVQKFRANNQPNIWALGKTSSIFKSKGSSQESFWNRSWVWSQPLLLLLLLYVIHRNVHSWHKYHCLNIFLGFIISYLHNMQITRYMLPSVKVCYYCTSQLECLNQV